jgi:hypothetical protein
MSANERKQYNILNNNNKEMIYRQNIFGLKAELTFLL